MVFDNPLRVSPATANTLLHMFTAFAKPSEPSFITARILMPHACSPMLLYRQPNDTANDLLNKVLELKSMRSFSSDACEQWTIQFLNEQALPIENFVFWIADRDENLIKYENNTTNQHIEILLHKLVAVLEKIEAKL